VVWGLMYFVLLAIEKTTGFIKKGGKKATVLKWVYTSFFVLIGWVFFRAESLADAVVYLSAMFGLAGNPFIDGVFTGWFTQNAILLAVGAVLCTPAIRRLSERTKDSKVMTVAKTAGLICLFVLSVASLVSNSYNPFIYFNF
ncbi:MAG: hypothetical protein IKD70_04880, partial [Eggerthellaceae bacterium]|nr:hypothetical protein [Eggerthellaceae bacterium]